MNLANGETTSDPPEDLIYAAVGDAKEIVRYYHGKYTVLP